MNTIAPTLSTPPLLVYYIVDIPMEPAETV
jgi:hypothetical protein